MSVKDKKLAKELFLLTERTQKEIAQIVGVTESTLSSWVNEGNWKDLKNVDGLQVNIRRKALMKLDLLLEDEDLKSADRASKYASIVRSLKEKEIGVSECIRVFDMFINYLMSIETSDVELIKKLNKYQDQFLRDFQI